MIAQFAIKDNEALMQCVLIFLFGSGLGTLGGYWLRSREKKAELEMPTISKHARTCLDQIKLKPTWDGDLMSKIGRDELMACGLSEAYNGWNFISGKGIEFLKADNLPLGVATRHDS